MTTSRFRMYGQYQVCVCGEIKAHHTADEPWSCRMRDCDCGTFTPGHHRSGSELVEQGSRDLSTPRDGGDTR